MALIKLNSNTAVDADKVTALTRRDGRTVIHLVGHDEVEVNLGLSSVAAALSGDLSAVDGAQEG